jgi:PhoH-like ATPase
MGKLPSRLAKKRGGDYNKSRKEPCLNNSTKTFVIDTNVFIHRPDALLSFRDNEVVIPLWVLEELDQLKSFRDERGRNARQAVRLLDEVSRHGNLQEGVRMENNITLKVVLSPAGKLPADLEQHKTDNKILLTALSLQKAGKRVFFVSKDINARLKATALGIKAVDYEKQKINFHDLFQGYIEIDASQDTFLQLREAGFIPWNDRLIQNQFVVLKESKAENRCICRYFENEGVLKAIKLIPSVSGIKPLNQEQQMALDLLLDDSIALVSLVGKAGTGKTLLALAAGFNQVLVEKKYSRVLVSRPIIPMGKDIGYLPGAKDEKLSHWMQPVFDNLDYIISAYKNQNVKNLDSLIDRKLIEVEALTYIRGRSLPEQFIIIDEAQNLSPHEIKTIVSRAGSGTKVVLTGDPYQIDSPYLDANSNGLTVCVEALKGQSLFGHITLHKSERSELAELAAELL